MSHLRVELPGAQVVFTSRRGGVSQGPYASLNLGDRVGDDPAAVAENRSRVEEELGVALALARQVHGSRVVGAEEAGGDADGVWTGRRHVAPAVLVADCLPVALSGPRGVAMLHGGWRGLAGGILEAGVAALGGEVTAAVIGPGAGPCCYEVGEDVARHFEPEARAGGNLDLPGIARRRLAAAGVQRIEEAGVCTICGDPDEWFSFRREGAAAGRQAGLVWRA